jgi:hypothetical protein
MEAMPYERMAWTRRSSCKILKHRSWEKDSIGGNFISERKRSSPRACKIANLGNLIGSMCWSIWLVNEIKDSNVDSTQACSGKPGSPVDEAKFNIMVKSNTPARCLEMVCKKAF